MEASSDAEVAYAGFAGVAFTAVNQRIDDHMLANSQICDI